MRNAAALLCVILGCSSETEDTSARAPDSLQQQKPPTRPLVFEARGRDFKWQFLTPGPDGDIASGDEESLGNDLIVPAATDVILVLTSEDYVYTLNVPDGRIEIAVPDMVHVVQFRSPTEGTHEFRTDPLCGLRYFHDDVLGTMRIACAPNSPESVSH
ncbi:MAG: hypothetical protein GY758_09610 [Fuerstiella sp.]|nr:hypothetical protein [Fuerstiella sp.]MCP4785089.1 hypothetical protein [Fuerstiella sp.]MCP4856037.1 hypothetical protein [Fuerstiella sp.]